MNSEYFWNAELIATNQVPTCGRVKMAFEAGHMVWHMVETVWHGVNTWLRLLRKRDMPHETLNDTIDNKIDKNSLQLGLDSYKFKCKDLFFRWLTDIKPNEKWITMCHFNLKFFIYFPNCTINHWSAIVPHGNMLSCKPDSSMTN